MMIGESAAMRRLRGYIDAVAPTKIPVLIEGETGTGKELVAALLHRESKRSGEFIAFNICALGDTMFEDALFGHVRGAYTGAQSDSLGFLREANGGTVFLDEISGLALAAQSKLLRAIESGVFRPIGSGRDARSDFRTVAATNEVLDDVVAAGRFRADLAHRLSGIILAVPALRDRIDDVPDLVRFFVERARSGSPILVTPAAIDALQARAWPGNVRELRQVIESALIFARHTLDVDALEIVFAQRTRAREERQIDQRMAARQSLVKLLSSHDWDTGRTASSLGVHRTTIYRRMRRFGIPVPTSDAHAAAK